MEENEKKEEVGTTENAGKGSELSTTPLIDATNEAAKRLEEATIAAKIENDRTEQIHAKVTLSGRGTAGVTPEAKKEISPEAYALGLQDGKNLEAE